MTHVARGFVVLYALALCGCAGSSAVAGVIALLAALPVMADKVGARRGAVAGNRDARPRPRPGPQPRAVMSEARVEPSPEPPPLPERTLEGCRLRAGCIGERDPGRVRVRERAAPSPVPAAPAGAEPPGGAP